jgi:hypothetical protein
MTKKEEEEEKKKGGGDEVGGGEGEDSTFLEIAGSDQALM